MATHNARLGKYLVLALLCLGLLAGLSGSGGSALLAQEATAEATAEVIATDPPPPAVEPTVASLSVEATVF